MKGQEKEGVALPTASQQARRRRILVLTSFYLPGVKGGGPIRSIAGLVEQLGTQLDLYILCRDRDLGDTQPYAGIKAGEWIEFGNATVQYLERSEFTSRRYQKLLHELNPDVVYLNTLFSHREFIVPVLVAMRSPRSVDIVVAPRGCLDPGALALKPTKKRIYLRILRSSTLPRRLIWQATNAEEAEAIREAVGSVRTIIAPNLPSPPPAFSFARHHKEPGSLRVIFLSRISPKKNLQFLLERMARIRGHIELTVAGPIEDADYWERSRRFAAYALKHVEISKIGTIPHDEISGIMSSHHIFALPTLGENFGHVILEASDAGLGLLISDRTPWHGLSEIGAGWEIPLEQPTEWEAALQQCVDMENSVFERMSTSARALRQSLFDLPAARRDTLALFGAAGSSEETR